MDSLVDHAQYAFLKGRCILDNIATAEEAIFSIHKRRLPGHILKVDFAKVFDSVDWDFLLELLEVRGFGSKWLGWIRSLINSSKASILINGSPNGYVRYQRGLRQGDPLSPLLFVLVSDVLCAMFDNAINSHVLIGVPLGEFGSICNLHYADDLLILTVGGAEDLRVIKLILLVFEGLSSLETNFSKTCLYSTNLSLLPDDCVAKTVNCKVGLLPVTYLGIPVSGRRPRSLRGLSKRLIGLEETSYRVGLTLSTLDVDLCLGRTFAVRRSKVDEVKSGADSLFWKDRWFNGLAPMHIWLESFLLSRIPNGTVRELAPLLASPSFDSDPLLLQLLYRLCLADGSDQDSKVWSLTANGIFSVKSFYCLLNDGGLRCSIANSFWKGPCPRKVNIFNWLAWKNKVLSLENLAKYHCNRLRTDTCVLCHSEVESVDHLFLRCRFSQDVWAHISRSLQLPTLSTSTSLLWGDWRSALRLAIRVVGDGAVKAFVWSIWLTRNDYIFSDKCAHPHSVMVKTDHMILSWFSAAPEGLGVKLDDSISSIRRSLEFSGSRPEGVEEESAIEVAQTISRE
ncbi:uncharacterized protein LOC120284108 [Dioscorea cayenensis subsp. rotundata]|uniref:Uncharacterized protein LOC120284108 n=1 Tax=Dioscorea cayennensis subsp. rotundata TaxID=55577 RepID=A0AB40D359_DIOCR|nr:uncharacterized protein LOC120284108 [Dioscorea cayenensis subsp. rotundata]